jgi:hypothetical protein
VQQVLDIEDPVVRNYWVTQTYADLAHGLARILDAATSNWCTYATWASFTVGRNLRGEELPKWLHDHIVLRDGMMGAVQDANGRRGRGFAHLVYELTPEHVVDVVRDLFGACAANLSDGNTKVFREIAPVAAAFIECFGEANVDVAAARARVLAACKDATEFLGQNLLRAGFTLWCDAVVETDTIRRSQLILAGSLELGAHEQNHLQTAIAGSMDMGVNQSAAALVDRLARGDAAADCVEQLTKVLHPVIDGIGDVWGDLMTAVLGTIETPDGVMQLDCDVPCLPGVPFVPLDLQPVVVSELARLLQRFDRSHGNGVGSNADDWVKLDDRMNFISNLFVSRHHRVDYYNPPFSDAVLAVIEADRIPGVSTNPRWHQPATIGLSQFTDEFINKLIYKGDDPADAAVDQFFTAEFAGHSELFRHLARSAGPGGDTDEKLPGVSEFVEAVEPWPDWADPDLVRQGQQVFCDWGPQLGLGLWMASLPADYACARGAEPLVRTARLTQSPKRRYIETGQMIIDAMTPDALSEGGSGYVAVRRVRVMHAAVRHVLLHADEIVGARAAGIEPWDTNLYGIPLNQHDLLGCLFSFSVVGIDALKRSGVRLHDADAEAYIHAWNLVGHMIGIEEGLLPLDWNDAQTLWESQKKLEYRRSEAGIELTASAIEAMHDLFGNNFFMRGIPAAGIRHYLGGETAEILGVPRADPLGRAFFLMVQVLDSVYERTVSRLPGTRSATELLGLLMLHGFVNFERDGERPNFEISDELKKAWGIRTS